ncbi:MAG: glycoside hydrolase family 5 protein, partial [Lachnospiraceae bacterium]|nr:glycoside hydrolase family 5 protein [Lachnospiraceae bacterium]
YTNIVNTTEPKWGFKLPEDSVKDRLFVAVHYYDWQFGLLETTQTTEFVDARVEALIPEFRRLEDTFTSKGIPVILGEYGAINKDNTAARVYHMEIVTRLCQQIGIVPCYWDQGWYDLSATPDFSFTLVDRETYEQVYPEIIAAMIRVLFIERAQDLSDIKRETTVTPITSRGTIEGTYQLRMGEVINISLADKVDKTAFNDVVLWKSADETVATVNPDAGKVEEWAAFIHAAGIGNTVITAYSQSGRAVLEIPVEVRAGIRERPGTGITTEPES